MASEAQRRAVAKYDEANTVSYTIKLNKTTDSDIINLIDSQDNKQGYIKNVLRNEIPYSEMRGESK